MTGGADRIAIVGGGPVGLTAAFLLARAGLPVTLFERETEVLKDYRASTFHPPTLDLLEDTGISDALVRMGIKCPIVQYRSWAEGKIAEFDHGLLKNDTRHPYRLQCEQYKLSGHLFEMLSKTPGVELRYGQRGDRARPGRRRGHAHRAGAEEAGGGPRRLRHRRRWRALDNAQAARDRFPRLHL